MSEYLELGKKLMKTITRVDSLLQAVDKADTIRIASRGLSLVDDVWEMGIKLTKALQPKKEGE